MYKRWQWMQCNKNLSMKAEWKKKKRKEKRDLTYP